MPKIDVSVNHYDGAKRITAINYQCGYCGNKVASEIGIIGYTTDNRPCSAIYFCPRCQMPTYHSYWSNNNFPDEKFGRSLEHLPKEVEFLYNEARDSVSMGCYTAAIMLCRKILMHTAVERGASPNDSFANYVRYLDVEGIIPKGSKEWVDYIREIGNETNHEIKIMDVEQASSTLSFLEALLSVIYELPGKLPPSAKKNS